MAVGGGTLAWLCTGIELTHAAGPEAYKLRIIHTNDHHARIEPVMGETPPWTAAGGVPPITGSIRAWWSLVWMIRSL